MATCPALLQATTTAQQQLLQQAATNGFLESQDAAVEATRGAPPTTPSPWQWRGCSRDKGVPSTPAPEAPWVEPRELCGSDAAQLMRVPLGSCGTLMQWGLPPNGPTQEKEDASTTKPAQGTTDTDANSSPEDSDGHSHNTYLVPRSVNGRVPAAAARAAALREAIPAGGQAVPMEGLAPVPQTAADAAADVALLAALVAEVDAAVACVVAVVAELAADVAEVAAFVA